MEENWKEMLLPLCAPGVRKLLQYVEPDPALEEIRIRAGGPLELVYGGRDRLLYAPGGRPAAGLEDCAAMLARMCEHSIYAWEEELRMGFLTLPGGFRVGLGGRVVMERGAISHVADVASLDIRIARAREGAATWLLPWLLSPDGRALDTLLFSPPGCGKTTLLRDIARQLSHGLGPARPQRVLIVDERMELSGSARGMPLYDLGPRTDVLTGCQKAAAIPMALRTLAPQVIITDELGGVEEADAVREARFSGVTTIASAHAGGFGELGTRRALAGLIQEGAFARLVLLGRSRGVGSIEGIWDENGRCLEEALPCCG